MQQCTSPVTSETVTCSVSNVPDADQSRPKNIVVIREILFNEFLNIFCNNLALKQTLEVHVTSTLEDSPVTFSTFKALFELTS